jgi:hypothetical protein
MKIKPGLNDALWMAVGAAALLIFMLVTLHLRAGQDPAAQLAVKAQRVDLVGRMRLDLASASEAEKSAVLAVTDQDSKRFVHLAALASWRFSPLSAFFSGLLENGHDRVSTFLRCQLRRKTHLRAPGVRSVVAITTKTSAE